jgi:hypothetical protein
MRRVAIPHLFALARLLQALERVLPDRLEHRETAVVGADEALVDERLERLEAGGAHLLRRLERPAAREDAEPREQTLLLLAQQVVAPLDRRAQRALPFGRVAGAAGQHRQSPVEPCE